MKTPPPAPTDTNRVSPFTLFAWLWAAGLIFHMASYSEPVETVTVIMVALALAVVFGSRRRSTFFLLLGAHLVYVFMRLPRVPNHSILAAAIDLTVLSAAAWLAAATRTWRIDLTALYKTFAPVARIELLVLYFFVVFHKLNNGFFDPQYSCGAFMYLRLADEYPFLPTGTSARWGAIVLTLAAEMAIPVLLLMRRLRLAGLLLAFVFHFALAMDPGDVVFNFSAILLSLFFLFLPDEFAEAAAETVRAGRLFALPLPPALMKTSAFAILGSLAVVLIFRDATATGLTFEASRNVWVLYAGGILTIFAVTLRNTSLRFPGMRELLTVPAPALLVIPALLFANGLLPYVGLKTETSFAMYSNLHTEGGRTNHWLMPVGLQVWDYQRDLVRIRRTSVPSLQRMAFRGYLWTYYEFKWLMREYPNATVTYERNGIVKRVRRVQDDPELAPGHRLGRKFLRFRPVAGGRRTPCIH